MSAVDDEYTLRSAIERYEDLDNSFGGSREHNLLSVMHWPLFNSVQTHRFSDCCWHTVLYEYMLDVCRGECMSFTLVLNWPICKAVCQRMGVSTGACGGQGDW